MCRSLLKIDRVAYFRVCGSFSLMQALTAQCWPERYLGFRLESNLECWRVLSPSTTSMFLTAINRNYITKKDIDC